MGRNLLIFGSSGSLGRGVADVLIRKNYDRIFLFDRVVNTEIEEDERIKKIVTGDLLDEENLKNAFKKIEIDSKSLYFLFSAVGGYEGGKNVRETEFESWKKMLDINLNIAFLIAKNFSNITSYSAGGSICFTTALTALRAERNKSAYGASKLALNYLIKALSVENADLRLTANAIAPYILDTKMNREWVTEDSQMVTPASIGELIDSIFNNFRILNGNIFELPGTLK